MRMSYSLRIKCISLIFWTEDNTIILLCLGDVEAACKLLKTQITNVGCAAANQNAMVIAITNNDFFTSEG
jgi:hypothetical protein